MINQISEVIYICYILISCLSPCSIKGEFFISVYILDSINRSKTKFRSRLQGKSVHFVNNVSHYLFSWQIYCYFQIECFWIHSFVLYILFLSLLRHIIPVNLMIIDFIIEPLLLLYLSLILKNIKSVNQECQSIGQSSE